MLSTYISNYICTHKSYLALNNTNLTGKLVLQVNKCITPNYSYHL